jgi:hypothetical protein
MYRKHKPTSFYVSVAGGELVIKAWRLSRVSEVQYWNVAKGAPQAGDGHVLYTNIHVKPYEEAVICRSRSAVRHVA